MSEIKGTGGELRGTLHIKRKATGKVETVELVGQTTPEEHEQIMRNETLKKLLGIKENDDGGDALDSK